MKNCFEAKIAHTKLIRGCWQAILRIRPYFKNVAQKIDPFESLLISKRKKINIAVACD